jgi:15-cis-phytoene synthase
MTATVPEDPRGRVAASDRDRYLAVLHAPATAQAGLFALFALDLELAHVVASTTEPMLGEIRLAWWREQLIRLDAAPAPAQPTLAALKAEVVPRDVTGRSLEPLEDAFLALLLDPAFDDIALERYARLRGGTLFGAAATVLGGDAAVGALMGGVWALGELVRHGPPPAFARDTLEDIATRQSWTTPAEPALRPLLGLARLAQRDIAAALSGRAFAPRGTAGRQARLAWAKWTGR